MPNNYLIKTVFKGTVKGGRGNMWTSNITDWTWFSMDDAVKKAARQWRMVIAGHPVQTWNKEEDRKEAVGESWCNAADFTKSSVSRWQPSTMELLATRAIVIHILTQTLELHTRKASNSRNSIKFISWNSCAVRRIVVAIYRPGLQPASTSFFEVTGTTENLLGARHNSWIH